MIYQVGADKTSELRDIDFSKTNPDSVYAVGYYKDGQNSQGISVFISTIDGFNSELLEVTQSGSRFGHISVSSSNEIRILGNKGFKIYNLDQNIFNKRYDLKIHHPIQKWELNLLTMKLDMRLFSQAN